MTECIRLSDHMPAVVLGRRAWSAEEIRHLRGCASCRTEWELVQAANRLGEKLGQRFDEGSVSRAVLARLGSVQAGRRRSRLWGAAGLAAAAAAGLIWAGSSDDRASRAPVIPIVAGLQIPLPELDSLQPAELDSVLQTIDEPGVEGSTLDSPDLGELDNGRLETVLDYWEG